MNDAHVYEMQVQMWKPNTWGVTLVGGGEGATEHKGARTHLLVVSDGREVA